MMCDSCSYFVITDDADMIISQHLGHHPNCPKFKDVLAVVLDKLNEELSSVNSTGNIERLKLLHQKIGAKLYVDYDALTEEELWVMVFEGVTDLKDISAM